MFLFTWLSFNFVERKICKHCVSLIHCVTLHDDIYNVDNAKISEMCLYYYTWLMNCLFSVKNKTWNNIYNNSLYRTRRFIGEELILAIGDFSENSPILKSPITLHGHAHKAIAETRKERHGSSNRQYKIRQLLLTDKFAKYYSRQ